MTPEHELESEDDEAPEEVTFETAKSRAEESVRARREAAKREKALLKEKRKRKEELFREQKKKKLLSDDILQSISSLPDKREEPREELSEQLEEENKTENEAEDKKTKKSSRRGKRLQNNYKVARLEDYNDKDFMQERAKSFIREKLYGQTKNRTTANERFSMSRKRSSIKKPAVQFTDNTWGEEMKQKAAIFKLHWMSRKKL
ncbi:U3 small nucleolar RNA-associated protein NOL7 [Leptodactylus fuscus]|uniref:U3 small nucleolar RNA-associated protein NOL7 n=1 Tax=Leptodactylus fuscus TaxID=238119 RepID=UPI003F4EE4DF